MEAVHFVPDQCANFASHRHQHHHHVLTGSYKSLHMAARQVHTTTWEQLFAVIISISSSFISDDCYIALKRLHNGGNCPKEFWSLSPVLIWRRRGPNSSWNHSLTFQWPSNHFQIDVSQIFWFPSLIFFIEEKCKLKVLSAALNHLPIDVSQSLCFPDLRKFREEIKRF